MKNENVHNLAEKIARILENEFQSPDFSSLQAGIDRINERLASLESSFSNPQSAKLRSFSEEGSQTVGVVDPGSLHPSQKRFAVVEAVADEVYSNYENEKACTFEPNGKPCDHCSMCSSLGY